MRFLLRLLLCALPITAFAEENLEERIILSTPEQIATLHLEPSHLIGGLISPLSGQLALRQTDLVIKGAQNLTLTRYYLPPSIPSSFPRHKKKQGEWNKYYLGEYLAHNYKGWEVLPQLRLEYLHASNTAYYTDAHGATLEFTLSNALETKLFSKPYAIHNAANDLPSGKYDVRNTQISYDQENNTFTVKSPDGTNRRYAQPYITQEGRSIFLLQKETLPNGKILAYSYDKMQLVSIESKDPKERFTYAKLTVDNHLITRSYKSSTGLQTTQSSTRRELKATLDVIPTSGQKVNFCEWNPFLPFLLTEVSSPFFHKEAISYDENFLLKSFSGKDHTFQCSYASYHDHFKLNTLFFPIGPNASFTPIYTFDYQPPVPGEKPGYTTVHNPDGTYLRYDFSQDLLMTSIQWLDKKKRLKKQKLFSWTKNHYLSEVKIQDETGKALHKKTYDYDDFGNPISETLHGNLTLESSKETYTITREFSKDGRHLLLKEQTEDGKVTTWEYLPETNLVTAKLIKDHDKILLREFYKYDDCHNLIEMLHDDGSSHDPNDLLGITQRIITSYKLRQQQPFLHMPELCTITYQDQREQKLLKQTHFVYDSHGNVKEEHIYDSNSQFAYTLYKTYNERGDLLTETNALGNPVTYDYDAHGRLKYKSSLSNRLHTTLSYDKQGRLHQKEEAGDNIHHLHTYKYDLQDRLIQKNDPFENTTTYTYDPITDQIIQTDFPSIASSEGSSLRVQTHATYDPLSRPITQTDANGNTTHTTYNAYGSPLCITYPDGAQETYRYDKNGNISSYTDPDGLTIRYKRDILGRVLKKEYFSHEKVAEESFTYSSFHLLSHKNKEGHTREYFYDGAGRKIREEFCNRVTRFIYSPLGFLEKVIHENDENTLIISYTRDNLGQILKEEKSDLSGNTLHQKSYSYDADGNQIALTRYINHEKATQINAYDPFGRLTSHTDPLGYLTTYYYDESNVNNLGQKTLQITIADPMRISKIKTYDAIGKVTEETTLDAHHQTVAHSKNLYDPSGNCIYRIDDVYHGPNYQTSQVIKRTYNARHQLESMTRGHETLDPWTTFYAYTPSGKLETKTNPNGITLTYFYDDLGYLEFLQSSDGQIDHSFKRNKEGDLLKATDEVTGNTITRKWDPFGNLTKETLPSGIHLEKSYDALDRMTSLEISDLGAIHYTYDPLYLKQVTRTNAQGSPLYTHTYNTYDLAGNLLSEELIHDLGTVKHRCDLKGRPTLTSSSYLIQTTAYNPCDQAETKVLDAQETHYTYDSLGQLTSETNENFSSHHEYDSLYNLTQKDQKTYASNPLNELQTEEYDLNGNQRTHEGLSLTYDPLNRLIYASKDNLILTFSYDPLGRRLSKKVETENAFYTSETTEYYIYDGDEEIGAIADTGELKNLKILGASKRQKVRSPIAIELDGKVFAPLLDDQNNICKLIDPYQSIRTTYSYSAFGEKGSTSRFQSPWRYFSKRTDLETGLVYFGKRYYAPEQARWLTPDPAGFTDSINLYQYALNNPLRYYDPYGDNLFGFLCGIVQVAAGAAVMGTGIALEVATLGGYTIALGVHESVGIALVTSGCAMTAYHAQDLSWSTSTPKPPSMDWSPYQDTRDFITDAHGNIIYASQDKKEKRHSPDQEAMSEFVKEYGRKGVTNEDADTLLDWADEYDFPHRDDRGNPHWEARDGQDHIHLGPKHIPVNN